MADPNEMQPNSLPPIGTTTATSVGQDYTLGARRQLESKGGKAERLARRYIRKYGDAGASAARDLLGIAAAEKLGRPAITTQLGRDRSSNTLKEEERSLLLRGAAAEENEKRMMEKAEEPEEQPTEQDTLTRGATPGTRGKPLKSTMNKSSTKPGSSLDYLRSPLEMRDRITGSREEAAKRKGFFGQAMDSMVS